MRTDLLASLHCPYSGSPFSLSKIAREDGEEMEYAIVTSEAGDFPIVDGILRLQVDEYRRPIVERVRARHLPEALTIALQDAPFGSRSGAAMSFASRLAFRVGYSGAGERLMKVVSNFSRMVTDSDATFVEVAEKFGRTAVDWQIFRFSMPTFLPVFPLLHIVRGQRWILDFGCGMGQASFLISRMWPNSKLVCADDSYCSLYLAKKYFVPDAWYVCLDGNYLLPFESGEFSTIFSSDALHCIDSKLSLAQEFRRVGSAAAVTILPHLHNKLAGAYAKSLTPNGYRRLFKGIGTRLLPEQEVVRNYFADGVLDLCRDCSDEELADSEQGLSLVASGDPAVFSRTEVLWDQRLRSFRHPCINPAYRISGGPGSWELTRQASDRYAKSFAPKDQVCLPATCKLAAPSIDPVGLVELQRADTAEFARLARSLVVLDLPERFMSERQSLRHATDRLSVRAAV